MVSGNDKKKTGSGNIKLFHNGIPSILGSSLHNFEFFNNKTHLEIQITEKKKQDQSHILTEIPKNFWEFSSWEEEFQRQGWREELQDGIKTTGGARGEKLGKKIHRNWDFTPFSHHFLMNSKYFGSGAKLGRRSSRTKLEGGSAFPNSG